MKATQLILLILLGPVWVALPQGQITFGNNMAALKAPIFGPELDFVNFGGDWANAKSGNTATNTPAGTQVYNGALLAGFAVSFWAAPGVVTNGHLLAQGIPGATIGTGSLAGYFPTTTVMFANLPPTGTATVQVRVTDPSALWAFGSDGSAGVSALFTVNIGGTATALRSFSVGWLDNSTLTPYVPEPTSISLLLMGAALCRRLRNSKT